MDQERADYGDPESPHSRAFKLLIALLVLVGVAAIATGGWIALLMLSGNCSKYG
jgi:hypothetical protein